MVNDRVKMEDRGSTRAAEQVFRTCQPMSSGPVAESELRVARNFSPFSGAKRHRIQEQWGTTGNDEYREGGVRDKIF